MFISEVPLAGRSCCWRISCRCGPSIGPPSYGGEGNTSCFLAFSSIFSVFMRLLILASHKKKSINNEGLTSASASRRPLLICTAIGSAPNRWWNFYNSTAVWNLQSVSKSEIGCRIHENYSGLGEAIHAKFRNAQSITSSFKLGTETKEVMLCPLHIR